MAANDPVRIVDAEGQPYSATNPLPVASAGGGGLGNDVNLIEVGGVAVSLGQKAMAASIPVVISSNQSAVPISGSFAITDPLPAGNNNIGDVDVASLPALPAGTNNIGDVDVLTLPALPAGNNNIGDVDVASLPALPAGNNNIGDVDVASLPAIPAGNNNIGDVDIASIAAGDNNIGNVDIVTLPAIPAGNNNIGDVDVATQPARAATTDSITAKIATDTIQNGLTALTPKFAAIAVAASGDNDLIALVSGKKIRVLAINFILSAATNVYIKDGAGTILWAGSTNTGNFAANSGIVLPFCPVGWFETAASQKLVANLSAANKMAGSIVYVEV